MGTYRVFVVLADGDDFAAPRTRSEIAVVADGDREALLVAQQMSGTPMVGKPAHMQIVRAEIVDLIE